MNLLALLPLAQAEGALNVLVWVVVIVLIIAVVFALLRRL